MCWVYSLHGVFFFFFVSSRRCGPNKHLYYYYYYSYSCTFVSPRGQRVYACIATCYVHVVTSREKSDEHAKTTSWFANKEVYALLQIVGGKRGTKCREEKESRYILSIFILVFCYSSNVLVCWFRLHSCVFDFGVHLKMWTATFDDLHIVVCGLQLIIFFTSSRPAAN